MSGKNKGKQIATSPKASEAIAKLLKRSDEIKATKKKEKVARVEAKGKKIAESKYAKQELNCVARLVNTQKGVDPERIINLKKAAAQKGSKKK